MATTTIPEEIIASLATNWALLNPLDAGHLHFDVGWVDRKQLRATNVNAQIIVSGPIASPIRYFGPDVRVLPDTLFPGLTLMSFHRYVVNIWVPIPAGDETDTWRDYAEQIRYEVVRILNEERANFTCTKIAFEIPLDEGIARHEIDVHPRILRYEITFQVNHVS